MTREEELEQAAYSQYCNSESICFTLMCDSFKQGAKWADNHPTVTWIDVSIDLPCNHEELVHDSWYTEQVFVRIVAKNGVILYTTNAMINVQLDKKWKWTCGEEYKVTHWMPIPKYE